MKITKSYCEGRAAAAKEAAITTNPFTRGQMEYDLWRNGWNSYFEDAGPYTVDDCAVVKGGGFVLSLDSSTLTLDAGDGTITATVEVGGVATAGIALTAVSSDTDVCTVSGNDDTDVSGEVEFAVVQVGDGTATVTISTALGTVATCTVTSENTP